jgi:V8-like Glu-specific endopeptidase
MKLSKLIAALFIALTIGAAAPCMAQGPEPSDEAGPDPAYGATNPWHRVSDSPLLRLPEDMRDWPPIEPSVPDKVVACEDPTAIEIHNVATGETTRIPSADLPRQPVESGLNSAPPYQGLLPPGMIGFESVLGSDDRVYVSSVTTYPWRTIVKLFVTFPDASGGCSGAIIGCPDGHGYHVLTAGHCVYSHDYGGWATSIQVVPGLDWDYMPYNYAWMTDMRSYTGWTVSGMSEHDWALVTLDRNVGDYTGWMGRMPADSSSSIYTEVANVAGYPGDLSSGLRMYWDSDYGHSADTYNHWYYMDTAEGQSGSPVWRYVSGSRYILTVHTCGTGGCGIAGNGCNHGTRLNNDKYDRIVTWCDADTPPTDYADLIDDGQAWSGFSPTTVVSGTTGFHVWSDVRNVGTASSGGFYVRYYASTNTYISAFDYLIGTDYVSSINAFNYRDSDWSGTFPSTIPEGTYWVGWIIDAYDNVTEFDEDNNTAYKSSYQLFVEAEAPPTGIYLPIIVKNATP